MAPPGRGMAPAWAAARRLFAIALTTFVLSAAFIVLENRAHITSGFLHVLSVFVAGFISLVLVHGLKIFEPLGF